jgi:hypothetical protein
MKKDNKYFIELIFWITFPAIIFIRLAYYVYRFPIRSVILNEFPYLFLLILLVIIPILFKLIFGTLPFQWLRFKNNVYSTINNENISNAEEYLLHIYNEAKALSEKIFSRAGAYLLIGILIAISGISLFLIFFGSEYKNEELTLNLIIVRYGPKFGGFVFVEMISFFFLRQYRITMDEFRYYEMIKRQISFNQEIILLQTKFSANSDEFERVMKYLNFFENLDLLKKDQSTILLENRKIKDTELENLIIYILDRFDIKKKIAQ